jgi:hypothetical protein
MIQDDQKFTLHPTLRITFLSLFTHFDSLLEFFRKLCSFSLSLSCSTLKYAFITNEALKKWPYLMPSFTTYVRLTPAQ